MSQLLNKRILIIGLGNMAKALMKGLLIHKPSLKDDVYAVMHGEKSACNARELGLNAISIECTHNKPFDIVLLAVKPQVLDSVLKNYKHVVSENTLFISVVAGVSIEKIQNMLGINSHVIRAMPNTPSSIGAGVTAIYAGTAVSKLHRNYTEEFFLASGSCVWIKNEAHMHIATALSGSGPAYYFYIIESMAEAAINLGLNREDAYKLAIETCKGAGAYASSCYPQVAIKELRSNVTSSGGTTEAGVEVLQGVGLKKIVSQVIERSMNKSILIEIESNY